LPGEAKTLFLKGGECTLAISQERKDELVSQYVTWVSRSQAIILTEYLGLTMKQLDDLRTKAREAGGEFHIVKNTLGKVAFEQAGLASPDRFLTGSTAVAFAFHDAPAVAKMMAEFARTSEFLKIKGGYLGPRPIADTDVKALAELPPLPVVRAQLLGTIMAPASKLARTLAEPGRQIAAVIKAFAERENQPAEAAA
jgi:large subunit ribosomal protein L10